ncbi:MAG: molybdenum cofactor biosynthesis protein MoaE [Bacteroidetes bacterium]|nr:molybdenum cofactor biosynthesis protein MoaE [Bacteroidota bacterium]
MKNISAHFVEGCIEPDLIMEIINRQSEKFNTGAQFLFLGQVRNDMKNGSEVKSIFYSAYHEMAEKIICEIEDNIISEYRLNELRIIHSTGIVSKGEISFLVFAASSHRDGIFEAVEKTVERIKKEAPVWKKEIFQ